MENRKVVKKIVFIVEMQLVSPLCVSNGDDTYSDSDLQRNFNGEKIFVPGSSLAGAMRKYLNSDEEKNCLFGYAGDDDGIQSPIVITDLKFMKEATVSIRDGVRLKDKVAVEKGKFDIEIIEPDLAGRFHLLLTIREGDDETKWIKSIYAIFSGIENGEIRFGSNKNRGFGKFSSLQISQKVFTAENYKDWLRYNMNVEQADLGFEKLKKEKWHSHKGEKLISLKAPLKLRGGISIRKYSAIEDINFEHICCNGNPIVPGTSWDGAIRSRAVEILNELEVSCGEELIKQWFGYVNEDKQQAKQSEVIIEESVISKAKPLHMTRNRINRFSAKTIDGALFTEKSYFIGKTELIVYVRKEVKEYKAIMGLLCLILRDIVNGYLAVGGQTAIGRGIFETNGVMELSEGTEEEFIKELACFLERKRKNV